MHNKELLRPLVRKDKNGNPKEGDLISVMSVIRETEKRIDLVLDHTKKANKYTENITEYLAFLESRGVCYVTPPDPVTASSVPTVVIDASQNQDAPKKKKAEK